MAWKTRPIDSCKNTGKVFAAGDGWEPLCKFLGVAIPPEPYPRVNSREEMAERVGKGLESNARRMDGPAGPTPPEMLETMVQGYLDHLQESAFPTRKEH